MSWVSENLMKDENIIYQGKLHWIIFVPGAILVVLGIGLWRVQPLSVVLILAGLIFVVRGFVKRSTTEIAVTNKRVIGKTGLIRRDTIDLNLAKVESLYADQGLFGRMLGYGAVRIKGTGGSSFVVKSVMAPMQYKTAANEQIDKVHS